MARKMHCKSLIFFLDPELFKVFFRKVFFGKRLISDLKTPLMKYKGKEKFLLPCSNLGSKRVVAYLNDNGIEFTESMMYQTVSSDLSDLADITYDCLVFFSP